jgi:hypothetical protein
MTPYSPTHWQPFFVAMITAAASLTGLLFVAVSINLDRIIKGAGFLPLRAIQTLATLLLVVLSCSLTLVPQNVRTLGLEILLLAAPTLVLTVRGQIYHRRKHPEDPLHCLLDGRNRDGHGAGDRRRTVTAPARRRRAVLAGSRCLARASRRRLRRLGAPGRDSPLTPSRRKPLRPARP